VVALRLPRCHAVVLTPAGYDFGEYTFQLHRFRLLQQASGKVRGNSDVGIKSGADVREPVEFNVNGVVRVAGMSLTPCIVAWALCCGELPGAAKAAREERAGDRTPGGRANAYKV